MALSGHNLSKNWADPQLSDAFRQALLQDRVLGGWPYSTSFCPPTQKRRLRSCGLRRSNVSSA
jgi:hypothetical protein